MTEQLQDQLATRLGGQLAAFDQWRAAFMNAPRHMFVPDKAWRMADDNPMTPIDRAREPDSWLTAVYSDDPILTQLDSTATPTSSCSMPFMVFSMLEHLAVEPGHRVLEIGTGTGWNAALLTARCGADAVYTIEVDPEVAEQATANLAAAGYTPTVITADGVEGYAPAAPFDRIIATCAVHQVPFAWIEQTQPGGVIVLPWDSGVGLGALLRLTVTDSGVASGPFVDTASFMWLRAQTPQQPDEPDEFEETAAVSTVTVDLNAVRANLVRFAVGLLVDDAKAYEFSTGETIGLLSADSWASVSARDGIVRQLGPRRLWDEVESAYAWWMDAGSPDLERFGVTVTKDRQTVWLDEPDNVISGQAAA